MGQFEYLSMTSKVFNLNKLQEDYNNPRHNFNGSFYYARNKCLPYEQLKWYFLMKFLLVSKTEQLSEQRYKQSSRTHSPDRPQYIQLILLSNALYFVCCPVANSYVLVESMIRKITYRLISTIFKHINHIVTNNILNTCRVLVSKYWHKLKKSMKNGLNKINI